MLFIIRSVYIQSMCTSLEFAAVFSWWTGIVLLCVRILLELQQAWATGWLMLWALNCSSGAMETASQIFTQSPVDTRRVPSSMATPGEKHTFPAAQTGAVFFHTWWWTECIWVLAAFKHLLKLLNCWAVDLWYFKQILVFSCFFMVLLYVCISFTLFCKITVFMFLHMWFVTDVMCWGQFLTAFFAMSIKLLLGYYYWCFIV